MTHVETVGAWIGAMQRGVAVGQRLMIDTEQRECLAVIAEAVQQIRARQQRLSRHSKCGACGAEVSWHLNDAGTWTPCNADGSSHGPTCPQAAQQRNARNP